MNIFEFRDQLIQSYQAFSRSFTKINSPDIRGEVERECFDKKRFWPDPLLQINPCYKTGKTTKELADAGKLHPTCGDIFLDREGNPLRLYKHQEQAVDLASKGSSYVVTTGTGSGKSMTFFIPIVDRILREKEAERLADGIVKPRTRAIVLYPMNALANSQFEEIEKYLKNAPDCGVTVGRYTGQDDTKKREALKANPPDILLTNYMMLELVLMRAGDRDLVRCAEGLEFLVLDELHTYRGRQGSDVAMLVRRLRSQLKTEALICVGTSATMASGESRDKQNEVVAGFATKIFGTRIPSEHVIAETLDRVTDARHVDQRPVLERAVRDAAKGQINLRDYEAFRKHPLAKWIEKELSVTPNLMRAEPKSLEDVAHALSKATSEPEEVTMRAVRNFLACFGNDDSVRTPDRRNPFPFKLHQFLSGPGKVYVTLEAPGTRIVTLDGQAYSQRGEETVRLYEAHFCLECGEEYIPVFATMGADGSVLSVSPRDIDEEAAPDQEDGNVVIGYLTPVRQDQRYQGNPEELPEDWLEESKRGELRVKRERRATVPKRVTLNASGLPDKAGADFWFMRGKFRFCVNCYRTASANGKDKNRLIGLSGEGRSSATSMLTLEMLELLYRSAEVNPERDIRKMLGFVDNRQDAALQAGHFNDFINQLILRGSLVGVLQNATGTFTLTALVDEIMRTFRFDDIYNQASLNEYLCNPANANGNLLQNALSIVRFGISYRLLLDLEDQNLYRSPSLERLGLLEIAYRDLEAFCGDDAYFKVNATLLALTAQDRFTLLKTFLDEMRRRRCIASRYLNPVEQDAMNAKDLGLVSARWSIFANRRSDQLRTGKFYAFDQRLAKDKRYANLGFVITERTQVVRRIAKQPLWKRALGHGMEPREACDVVRGIGEVLLKMGIVRATAIKNGDTFQIDESAILWGRPAEGAKVQNEFYRNLYFQTAALLQSNPETLFAFEGQEHRNSKEIKFTQTLT